MSKNQTIFSEIHVALSIAKKKIPTEILGVDDRHEAIYSDEFNKRSINRIKPLTDAGVAVGNYLTSRGIDTNAVEWTGSTKLGSYVVPERKLFNILIIFIKTPLFINEVFC